MRLLRQSFPFTDASSGVSPKIFTKPPKGMVCVGVPTTRLEVAPEIVQPGNEALLEFQFSENNVVVLW